MKTAKGKQNLSYDSSHSFFKHRNVEPFKKLSSISKFKYLIEFRKDIRKLKILIPKKKRRQRNGFKKF